MSARAVSDINSFESFKAILINQEVFFVLLQDPNKHILQAVVLTGFNKCRVDGSN